MARPSAQEVAFRQAQANISNPPSRYIPGYASGAARQRQTAINQANIAAGRTPAPTTGLPTRTGTPQTQSNITAPAPSAPRTLNWRDAAYNAQIAAVERALRDFETGATRRGERYGQDYMTSVSRLGYRPGEGFEAMPNLVEATQAAAEAQAAEEAAPLVTPVSGAFDIEGQYDPYSTAAQGTRSMRDVFAGRGTLRSSDFAKSFGEFQNRLNRQLEAMETSRGRFAEDLAQEIAAQRTGAQERREAAQREAMMRAAMAAAGGAGF